MLCLFSVCVCVCLELLCCIIVFETGLPNFDTVAHNSACSFIRLWQNCDNGLTEYFSALNIAY